MVEGTYTKERRMTFNETKSARRHDTDLDQPVPKNEYRLQDCILQNLGVGIVSQFPVDYMHLTLLALVRKIGRMGCYILKLLRFRFDVQ